MYSEAALGLGRALWRSSGSRGAIIPADGCVDLILREDEVFVAGPSTMWIATLADGETGSLGLRFSPGGAAVLGLELAAISDQLAPFSALVGVAEVGRVREVLLRAHATGRDPADAEVAALGMPAPSELSWAREVRRHARRGTPPHRVAELVGCSQRTFRRRMLGRFGYPYPTLVRLERAGHAQALLKDGAALVDAAARAGYADQPHLSREFRRLVGASPGQFAASTA